MLSGAMRIKYIPSKRFLLCASMVIFLGCAFYFFCPRLLSVTEYTLFWTTPHSSAATHDVQRSLAWLHLQSKQQQVSLTASTIIDVLSKKHPYLKTISVLLEPGPHGNKARISLSLQKPFCMINRTHVLLENSAIISSEFIPDVLTVELPQAQVHDWYLESDEIPQGLGQCLLSCDASLLRDYKVIWHDEHAVYFRHKEHPTFCILSEPHAVPSMGIQERCDAIRALLARRALLETPSMHTWIADVRFRNHIVLSVQKEEVAL